MTRGLLNRLSITLLKIALTYFACGNSYLPEFNVPMLNISAERGEDVVFICTVEHLGKNKIAFLKVDPPALLTWQYKTFATKPHKYRLENRQDVKHDHWSLTIHNVQEEDSGAYMCQVGTNPPLSQTAYLSLKVPPKINQEKSTKHDIIVFEKDNVTMHCAADGSPTPFISWKRHDDGVIVTNDPEEGVGAAIIYKPNLTMYRVTRRHMTDYVCLADNGVLPSSGYTVKLHVHFKPFVEAVESKIFAKLNSDVKLQCRVEAWPKAFKRWWTFGDKRITNNGTKYLLINEFSVASAPYDYHSLTVLIVRSVTSGELGTYSCVAENDYGEIASTVEISELDETEDETENSSAIFQKKTADDTNCNDSVPNDDEEIKDTKNNKMNDDTTKNTTPKNENKSNNQNISNNKKTNDGRPSFASRISLMPKFAYFFSLIFAFIVRLQYSFE